MDQETLLIFPQRGVQSVIGIYKGVSTIRKIEEDPSGIASLTRKG